MFVVCGEALMDLFGDGADGRVTFDARMGGSPFNVAIGLSRLDQRAALFTGISNDPLGQGLAGALERDGVNGSHLLRTERPTTLSVVNFQSDGQPIYTFYGERAADRMIEVADLPDLGNEVWGLHAGSYSLVVEPVGSALLHLFEREAGRRLLTLDPNVRLNVEPDLDIWRDRVARFVELADVVKVSDEDLDLLYPGRDAPDIAEGWLKAGPALVIVTRGGNGADYFRALEHGRLPGRTVEVVDTVGAGDTFQAALIAGLAELGLLDRDAIMKADTVAPLVDFAIGAAAITCTRRGADLPHRHELAAAIGSLDERQAPQRGEETA